MTLINNNLQLYLEEVVLVALDELETRQRVAQRLGVTEDELKRLTTFLENWGEKSINIKEQARKL